MLHPSTKRLLDRLAEMTRQRKIAWTETETGVAYETEGYSVVLTDEPQSMQLLSRDGNVLEDVGADAIGATATDEGESYQEIFASLSREASRLARGTETAIDEVLAGLDDAPEVAEPVMAPAANVQPVDDGQPGSLEDVADETQLAADTQPEPEAETVTETETTFAPEPVAEVEVTDEPDVASAVADMANQVNSGETEPAERPQWSSPLSGMTSGGSFGDFDSVGEAEQSVEESSDPAPAETETSAVETAVEEPVAGYTPAYGDTEAETPAEHTSEVTHDWGTPASSESDTPATDTAEEAPVSSWAQQPVEETPFEPAQTEPAETPVWGAAASDDETAAQDDPVEPEPVTTFEEPAPVEDEPQTETSPGFVATSYEEEPAPAEPVETAPQSWSETTDTQPDESVAETTEQPTETSGDWPTFGGVAQSTTEQVTEVAETTERVVIDATDDALERADDMAEAVDSSAEAIGSAVESSVSAVEETVTEASEAVEDAVSEIGAEAPPEKEPPVSSNYGAFSLGQPETPPAAAPAEPPAPTPEETVAGGVEEEPEEPEPAPKPRPVTRFNPWN